ncbi:hypothetical protein PAXRUDRAFT_169082, partial [Paxillus rubicundulus Ve08.2h10]
ETLAIRKWLVDDVKTKGFIHHFLSTLICQIVPNDQATTARAIWDIIGRHYGCKDLSTQFVIRKQLATLHMKDASDASRYVGEHLSLRCHLLNSDGWAGPEALKPKPYVGPIQGFGGLRAGLEFGGGPSLGPKPGLYLYNFVVPGGCHKYYVTLILFGNPLPRQWHTVIL